MAVAKVGKLLLELKTANIDWRPKLAGGIKDTVSRRNIGHNL